MARRLSPDVNAGSAPIRDRLGADYFNQSSLRGRANDSRTDRFILDHTHAEVNDQRR
jgi:hypothetical protein